MHLLLRWVVSAVALGITIFILQALHLGAWTGGAGAQAVIMALFAVVVMGIVNAIIRPIVQLLTLPLNCLTFGLFSFVINALMFWLVGWFTEAFRVGFVGALVGSIVMSLVGGLANHAIVAPQERAV